MMTAAAKYGGLIFAPLVWAINTQLGQILPYVDCSRRMHWSLVASSVAILLAVASSLAPQIGSKPEEARTGLFIRHLSVLVGLVFAFALVLQGGAAWLLNACEH
ncbi:hypothetical protein PH547_33055 [Rhizobium sp. CNPSo 3464]|uniref:hypothetical protein n=1 Tax=Rhizobium sp. CNPSo 3464 TaxID=3021406 RepID=UPI00254E25AC|nr:hypothetical protein [Rhizobium sp. CNPSo 3464]MDK4743679.1 hypothetical protein [Rhizobium sp. CNPSo 3464]